MFLYKNTQNPNPIFKITIYNIKYIKNTNIYFGKPDLFRNFSKQSNHFKISKWLFYNMYRSHKSYFEFLYIWYFLHILYFYIIFDAPIQFDDSIQFDGLIRRINSIKNMLAKPFAQFVGANELAKGFANMFN